MKPLRILLVAAALVSPSLAFAQETPAPSAAEELYALMNPREVMVAAITAAAEPAMAQVPAEKKEAVRKAFLKFAESIADSPDLKTKMVAIYAEAFTEPELKEMLVFYQTPIGKKSLQKMPELFQKGMLVGQEIGQQKQAAFQAELQAIMKGE